jgi:membrane-bound inhibitor of C-type lysozyme
MCINIPKSGTLTLKPRSIIIKQNEFTLTLQLGDKVKMNKISCTLSCGKDSITHEKGNTTTVSPKKLFSKQMDKSKQGYTFIDDNEETNVVICKKFTMDFYDWKMNTKWNKIYLNNSLLPDYVFSYAVNNDSVNFGKHDLYGYTCYHKKLMIDERDCAGKYEVFLRHIPVIPEQETPPKACYLTMSHTHKSSRILYQIGENNLDIAYNHLQENILFSYILSDDSLILKKSSVAIRDNTFFDLHKELIFEDEDNKHTIPCSSANWKRMLVHCDMSKFYTEHSSIVKKVFKSFKQTYNLELAVELIQHDLNKMNY